MPNEDETGRGARDAASGRTAGGAGVALAPEADEDELIGAPSDDDDAGDTAEAEADFGPPFQRRSFGGEIVWAAGAGFVAKMLRIRAQGNVAISTDGRVDLTIMLTGGRGVLEIRRGAEVDLRELEPAVPFRPDPAHAHRLLALTEVELLTVYTPG
jgi:hypothetical protein